MQTKQNFAQQINKAQHQAMRDDSGMICMGLGINDPKRIFNTTQGLVESFGEQRVFDMPTAENGMTGIGIGAAIAGTRVLMTHQRVDFFLLAMDQLVNNAAKWHYMFNGQMNVPLTIRLIVGRGWGQGPTHQQSLQAWFAHIPGLKVITPSRTENVGQLLYQAIMDNNPVVFLEHRWLHNQVTQCHEESYFQRTSPTTMMHGSGKDITLIANSYMLLEAFHAQRFLETIGISAEVIEIAEPSNIDYSIIQASVNNTGHCIVCEMGHSQFSVASEITATITERCFSTLKKAPKRIGLPNYPEPTSAGLTKNYYPDAHVISETALNLLERKQTIHIKQRSPHDVPGDWFQGPF